MSRLSHRVGVVVVALIVVLVGGGGGLAAAQSPSPHDPIILVERGDLWAWSGPDQPLKQLTFWGMNERPVLSPDGTRVVYWSGAQIFMDWIRTIEGGTGGYDPPGNLWMLDLPSGHTYRVADQPEGAAWTGPNNSDPGLYILRRTPVWSPDSRQLAWVEVLVDLRAGTGEVPAGTVDLMVYDLASGTTEVLDSFAVEESRYGIDMFLVQWGQPGIAVSINERYSFGSLHEFRVYDPPNGIFHNVPVDDDTPGWLYSAIWIEDQGQYYLADVRNPPVDAWMDWNTKRVEPVPGALELVSAVMLAGARFTFDDGTWHLTFPGQAPVDLGEDVQLYGISRDGQWVAYGRYGKNPANGYFEHLLIVESSNSQTNMGWQQRVQLVWGPVNWQIRH